MPERVSATYLPSAIDVHATKTLTLRALTKSVDGPEFKMIGDVQIPLATIVAKLVAGEAVAPEQCTFQGKVPGQAPVDVGTVTAALSLCDSHAAHICVHRISGPPLTSAQARSVVVRARTTGNGPKDTASTPAAPVREGSSCLDLHALLGPLSLTRSSSSLTFEVEMAPQEDPSASGAGGAAEVVTESCEVSLANLAQLQCYTAPLPCGKSGLVLEVSLTLLAPVETDTVRLQGHRLNLAGALPNFQPILVYQVVDQRQGEAALSATAFPFLRPITGSAGSASASQIQSHSPDGPADVDQTLGSAAEATASGADPASVVAHTSFADELGEAQRSGLKHTVGAFKGGLVLEGAAFASDALAFLRVDEEPVPFSLMTPGPKGHRGPMRTNGGASLSLVIIHVFDSSSGTFGTKGPQAPAPRLVGVAVHRLHQPPPTLPQASEAMVEIWPPGTALEDMLRVPATAPGQAGFGLDGPTGHNHWSDGNLATMPGKQGTLVFQVCASTHPVPAPSCPALPRLRTPLSEDTLCCTPSTAIAAWLRFG